MTALRLIPREPFAAPDPSLDYEWQQRQRIAARDWAAVHVASDRRRPIFIPDRVARLWR